MMEISSDQRAPCNGTPSLNPAVVSLSLDLESESEASSSGNESSDESWSEDEEEDNRNRQRSGLVVTIPQPLLLLPSLYDMEDDDEEGFDCMGL